MNGINSLLEEANDTMVFEEGHTSRICFRLVRIERDKPGGPALMELVAPRIKSFSHRWGSDGEALLTEVWGLFAQKSVGLGLWAALDTDESVIGHALATVQMWDRSPVGWVHQVKMDFPATTTLKDGFLGELEGWLKDVNATLNAQSQIGDLMMCSPRMKDSWARHAGFMPYRMIYRREVK